ncbi:hypothetical protein CK203_007314 [Vitis vinifera]|uniref:Uncharacterized protein n=1 Tax=Vitis vinifera TaxID=29760 RepID=A0A438G1N6_VITVI|nr:hypothetical protein CK203_007314 [Vitis vinifera]
MVRMAVGFHDDLPERTAFATKTGSFCNLEAGDFRKF